MGMTTDSIQGHVPQWTFADRLRKVRREVAHLGQAEFAGRIGAGDKAYAAWEAGTNSPRGNDIVDVARRIEAEFGVPASWTLGLSDPPAPKPPAGDGLKLLTEAKRSHSRRSARATKHSQPKVPSRERVAA